MTTQNQFSIRDDLGDGDFHVVCPVCGFEYVHMGEPIVTMLGNVWPDAEPETASICIPMTCENGHAWDMTFQFHEGISMVRCKVKEPPPPCDSCGAELVPTTPIVGERKTINVCRPCAGRIASQLADTVAEPPDPADMEGEANNLALLLAGLYRLRSMYPQGATSGQMISTATLRPAEIPGLGDAIKRVAGGWGEMPSSQKLGIRLKASSGRVAGKLKLTGNYDSHSKQWLWSATPVEVER